NKRTTIPGTTTNIFTSDDPSTNNANDATQFYFDRTGTFAGFVTLVNAYNGGSPPNVTASLVGTPTPGGSFQVQITRNGVDAELITFTEPAFVRPPADFRGAAPIAGANDIAWDSSGRLHMVWQDTNTKYLKYYVRDSNGIWSIVQTIDNGQYTGGYPSLAMTSTGSPGVAYFDGNGGDLKYAQLVNGAWQVQTVDSAGS